MFIVLCTHAEEERSRIPKTIPPCPLTGHWEGYQTFQFHSSICSPVRGDTPGLSARRGRCASRSLEGERGTLELLSYNLTEFWDNLKSSRQCFSLVTPSVLLVKTRRVSPVYNKVSPCPFAKYTSFPTPQPNKLCRKHAITLLMTIFVFIIYI